MPKSEVLTRDMSRKELVEALLRLNPFGGYSVSDKITTEALRRTVVRYRIGPATDEQIDEVLAEERVRA